jgi:hypothetical protein
VRRILGVPQKGIASSEEDPGDPQKGIASSEEDPGVSPERYSIK